MAGKQVVFGSPAVAYAIDQMSKNALADIILDRVIAELGDKADDIAILTLIQQWAGPALRTRGDKPANLVDAAKRYHAASEKYRKNNPQA